MSSAKSPSTICVSDIQTELGNQVLRVLLQSGWQIEYEYPDTAMDKGIDFNAYTLVKGDDRLEFEWDNWDEWQLRGSPSLVRGICAQFAIPSGPQAAAD